MYILKSGFIYLASLVIAYVIFSVRAARKQQHWQDLVLEMLVFPIPLKTIAWPVMLLIYISDIHRDKQNKRPVIPKHLTQPFVVFAPGPDDPTDIEPEVLRHIDYLSKHKAPPTR
jgi:hypothetical protein